MPGIAEIALAGAPLAGGALLGLAAGNMKAPDVRGLIKQDMDLLDRLPESMTDQTRTGTYGSWYNYYVCGFSGRITLPAGLGALPGVKLLMDRLNHLEFHSTAPRCNGATAP